MAAKLSGGTAAAGVVAYQDHLDPNQFHYVPANAECILGESLSEFSARYWGIGNAFYMQDENGSIKSVAGALLAGRASIDISSSQREKIRTAIARAYGVNDPKLIPLMLQNVKVQPVIGERTLRLGADSDIIFPDTLQLATSFNYLVGTGNSLFASFVGAQDTGTEPVPDPSFGINMVGDAEFQGDPWRVKVTADLSQVWSYTRQQFSAGISFGWWRINLGDYDRIIQDMSRKQVIKLEFEEGSLDNEKFGRQIFELGKELFQAVSQQASAQEGFFKFEPNPTPAPSEQPGSGKSWAFRPFINLSYGEQSIRSTQSMHYEATVNYHGRVTRQVPASMTLAVGCNPSTQQHFRDLGYPDQPCITADKVATMQARLGKEHETKSRLAELLLEKFIMDEITEKEYYRKIALLNGISTEDGHLLRADRLLESAGHEHRFEGTPLRMGLDEREIMALLDEPMDER